MNTSFRPHLDSAVAILGGLTAAAEALPGVKRYQTIQQWRVSGVPVEHCPNIERMTGKKVTRRDLRPDDWWIIWPELVTKKFPIPAQKAAA